MKRRAWDLFWTTTSSIRDKNYTQKVEYFIAAMSLAGFKPGTINSYVSGIKSKLTKHNVRINIRRIKEILKGAGCNQAKNKRMEKIPVTTDILRELNRVVNVMAANCYEASMFKSAFSLSFYGLLRVGEITEAEHVLAFTDVQVLALTNRSLPDIAKGIAFCCTGVVFV